MTNRPPEQDDLDAVLDPLVRFAEELLEKNGEFFPFGNVMRSDGEVELVAGDTGSDRPPSADVIELLMAGMYERAQAGEIRASGICFDARTRTDDGRTTDAIVVAFEHREGDPLVVFRPYAKRRFRGIQFGERFSREGERRIFP